MRFRELLLFATLVCLATCQQPSEDEPSLTVTPKIRNVDDPAKDPAEYSRQWIGILGQLEASVKEWPFSGRFHQAIQSNGLGNVSESCLKAMTLYFDRPLEQEWSFKMWDSNGHFPSGILAGSFFEPGNYDQCMEIDESPVAGTGKYCILELRAPPSIRLVNFTGSRFAPLDEGINYLTSWDHFAGIANGLCLPSVCTDAELAAIVPSVLPQTIRDQFRIQTRLCQEPKTSAKAKEEPMRFGQRLAVVIIAVHCVLALLGTLISWLAPQSTSLPLVLLSSFSIWANSRILFHINKSNKEAATLEHPRRQFKFIHGLRVISIYWVVYAHVFLFHPFLELHNRVSPAQNLDHRKAMASNPLSHIIANGGLAVGTFFVISGALTIYSILPVFKKNPINFFNYALLRWARFAPPILGNTCFILLWPLFGSGPLFVEELTSLITGPCYTNWWTNFLFITNFYHSSEMCNVMTWYLAADFQLHLLLFLVIYFFYRQRMLTNLFIGAMFIIGFISPAAVVLFGIADAPNPSIFLHPTHKFPMDKVGMFIFGTQNHLIPYFGGVILGLLFLRKRPLNISPIVCWLMWLVVFPLAMLLPFASMGFIATTEPVEDPLGSAITFSIVRLIWASGIAWLCYECASGRASFIRRILSADWLQPLSRLSFAIYLAHILPIWHTYFSIRNPVVISMSSFLYIGTAQCVYATLLAYLLYLLFEAPYVNLMKVLIMPIINGTSRRSRASSSAATDANNNSNGKSTMHMTAVGNSSA